MKKILLLAFVALQVACASALKKQCESTNWFQHGYNVAMSGKRLDADDFANRCAKEGVEANSAGMDVGFKAGMQNYCKPDIVYAKGKEGEYFSDDFCEPNQIRTLRARHVEGIKEFCQEENGFKVGASGRLYNNICPKELEKPFMARYRKGRKVYLGNEVVKREQQIHELDSEIARYDRERVEHVDASGNRRVEYREIEDPAVKSQIQNMQWDLSSIDQKIQRAQSEQKRLRTEMFDLKKEQASIED